MRTMRVREPHVKPLKDGINMRSDPGDSSDALGVLVDSGADAELIGLVLSLTSALESWNPASAFGLPEFRHG